MTRAATAPRPSSRAAPDRVRKALPGRQDATRVTPSFRAREPTVNIRVVGLRRRRFSLNLRGVEPMSGSTQLTTESDEVQGRTDRTDAERGDGVDDVGGGGGSRQGTRIR